MKHLAWALFGLTVAWSTPVFADQDCSVCPRVQLQRVESQVRIAAEDDRDAYEDLKFRVRFITSNGASGWTEWADTNAYGLRTTISGRIEAESVDLDGNVGRGVIHITAPTIDEPGTRGPGTVEEDSQTEARWGDDATNVGQGGATAEDLAEEMERTTAEQWLDAQEYDHSVCPVSSADDDAVCSTARNSAPAGVPAALLMLVGLVFGWRRR